MKAKNILTCDLYLKLSLVQRFGLVAKWEWVKRFDGRVESSLKINPTDIEDPISKQVFSDELASNVNDVLTDCHQSGIHIVTPANDSYPKELFHLNDPPLALFCKGDVELLNDSYSRIAIVGTRRASMSALGHAYKFAHELTKYGAVVVSGLARGIDTRAHEGSLAAEGPGIAVLGSGLNQIYPAENRKLANCMGQHGVIVSEYLPNTKPAPYHFPMRNRIIAALSKSVLVVEAPLKSGALITAGIAADLGRDVMVLPGNISNPSCEGTNQLLGEGAMCITGVEEAMYHLDPSVETSAKPSGSIDRHVEEMDPILRLLDYDQAQSVDDLVIKSGELPDKLLATLTRLQLEGSARELAGSGWVRYANNS